MTARASALLAALLAVSWCGSSTAADTEWRLTPVVLLSHTSALTRGQPFRPEVDEWSVDRLEVGMSLWSPKRTLEFSLTQGRKRIRTNVYPCRPGCGRWYEESTTLEMRWYPKGLR